ncbi:MAG: hypothetical protein VXX27_02390 [Pseudomonadota bacterium]|nr:hypothetical protein [Pseudomonadota bacterium]
MAAQGRLAEIQGTGDLYFAGAWTGHGFHEDGLRSAVRVALSLGVRVPWSTGATPYPDPVTTETREIA